MNLQGDIMQWPVKGLALEAKLGAGRGMLKADKYKALLEEGK